MARRSTNELRLRTNTEQSLDNNCDERPRSNLETPLRSGVLCRSESSVTGRGVESDARFGGLPSIRMAIMREHMRTHSEYSGQPLKFDSPDDASLAGEDHHDAGSREIQGRRLEVSQ